MEVVASSALIIIIIIIIALITLMMVSNNTEGQQPLKITLFPSINFFFPRSNR